MKQESKRARLFKIVSSLICALQELDYAYDQLPYEDEDDIADQLAEIRATVNVYTSAIINMATNE